MNQTTKSITLVLLSSALVFVGWGCPVGHDAKREQQAGLGRSSTHYRGGYIWGWHPYYHSTYYSHPGSTSSRGVSSTGSGTVSSRGGFGSSGVGVGG